MHRLVYISVATTDISEDILKAILADARATNSQFGVTGALVYQEGKFFQCLEGTKDDATRILTKIEASRLHKGVKVILDETAQSRLFPEWSMGFASITGAEEHASFRSVVDIYRSTLESPEAKSTAAEAVRQFLLGNISVAA